MRAQLCEHLRGKRDQQCGLPLCAVRANRCITTMRSKYDSIALARRRWNNIKWCRTNTMYIRRIAVHTCGGRSTDKTWIHIHWVEIRQPFPELILGSGFSRRLGYYPHLLLSPTAWRWGFVLTPTPLTWPSPPVGENNKHCPQPRIPPHGGGGPAGGGDPPPVLRTYSPHGGESLHSSRNKKSPPWGRFFIINAKNFTVNKKLLLILRGRVYL